MSNPTALVQKLWNHCNILRDDGLSYGGPLAAAIGTVSGFGSDERPNAMILFNPACTLAPIAGWRPAGVRPGKLSAKRFGVEAEVISPGHWGNRTTGKPSERLQLMPGR